MAQIGIPCDRWQCYVLNHGLGMLESGKWAASTIGTWVSRQNGKGNIILARELGGLYIFDEKLISHSAHLFQTAEEGFLRLKEVIEGTDFLRKRVHAIKEANGVKGVVMQRDPATGTPGGRLRIMARGPNTGRGMSIPLLIPDEAQELDAQQVRSLGPTQAAMPNPQMWLFGTPPGRPDAWAYTLRRSGHTGAPRLAFFDWGVALDLNDPHLAVKVMNRDLWAQANPALGIRISEEYLEAELALLGPVDFAIEHLGVWLPQATEANKDELGLDYELWESLFDAESQIAEWGEMTFGVDTGPAREYTSISVYGERDDAAGHVELIKYELGTTWAAGKLAELKERFDPIAIGIDGAGPAKTLIPQLARVGIKPPEDPEHPQRGDLMILNAGDMTAACGGIVDASKIGEVFHIGQAQLNLAVKNAKPRPLGDAWAFGRRHSTGDISPIVSATIAHYVHGVRAPLVMNAYDPENAIG